MALNGQNENRAFHLAFLIVPIVCRVLSVKASEALVAPSTNISPERSDVIILGCGVSGLAAAYELSQQGLQVTVLENYSHAGGNHLSRQIDGMSFDIGAIFFWSTSQMFDMFPSATATWLPVEVTTGRVTPAAAVHTYPIDVKAELLSLPFFQKVTIAADVIYHKLFHRKRETVRDFALQYLGQRLFKQTGLEVFSNVSAVGLRMRSSIPSPNGGCGGLHAAPAFAAFSRRRWQSCEIAFRPPKHQIRGMPARRPALTRCMRP